LPAENCHLLLLLLLLLHCLSPGAKTGRCPRDKRVVREPSTEKDIWWASTSSGSPNYEMDERSFLLNRETAVSYLNSLHHVFVFDGYANWDPEARIKVGSGCSVLGFRVEGS
jgi:phosphoenolpyruvate carboxykinase (ATP)